MIEVQRQNSTFIYIFYFSLQLRRTENKILSKTYSTPPTRSQSMQCLSSTNEAFLSQKIDLIAELKMSKDINGIRKLRVEKAKMEGSYDKEAYTDITKQFTATHFVETVSISFTAKQIAERMIDWVFFIGNSRFLRKTMLAM